MTEATENKKEEEFMLRAMYTGISGLRNFQTKLDVIGNNIANVNTYGFKKGRVAFQDMLSQQLQGASSPTANRGGTNPRQIGLGATIATIDTIQTQGSPQTTNRSLDAMISGDGFFVVSNGNLNYYTRAGNFYLDQNGTLVTADGLRVMGYAADENGNIDRSQLTTLAIASGDQIAPVATTMTSFKGNLNADFASGAALTAGTRKQITDQLRAADGKQTGVIIKYPVVDSLGGEHTVELVFQKTNGNEWTVYQIKQVITNPPAADPTYNVTPIATLRFGSDGKIDTNSGVTISSQITINQTDLQVPNGAQDLQITLTPEDFLNVTQYSGSSTIDVDEVDGSLDGFLESFNIGASGEITGVYSNGQVRVLGQIAVATFDNPEGLNKTGNNTYQVSNNSGQPNIGVPGEGRGTLIGAALEMSNVDLSEEFTEMIVAQRGFQANTRIITTSDEILQELVNLKR